MALTTSTIRGADGSLHEVLLDTITDGSCCSLRSR
jgi:hypothetical protein